MEVELQNTFFKPWVGTNYSTGFNGKKILVLGESHYCGEGCENCGIVNGNVCESFTSDVINEFLNYKLGNAAHKRWMNTFTKFVNVIHGDNVESLKHLAFWNSVIFFNYVQRALDGPRISPTVIDFEKSKVAFYEVIGNFNPDLIIVWGKRLWDRMPDDGAWGDQIHPNFNNKYYYYTVANKTIPAFYIYHPSSTDFNSSLFPILNRALSQ